MRSILTLFNGVVIEGGMKKVVGTTLAKNFNINAIKIGYFVHEDIIISLSFDKLSTLTKLIESHMVTSFREWNQTFHKSWSTIVESSDLELFLHQIFHYMTTYGPGVDSSFVYLPKGNVMLPELTEDIKLFYVRPLTKEYVKKKLDNMITSGVALKKETIDLIIDAYKSINVDLRDVIGLSKNKELTIILCEKYDLIPQNSIAFLRYVIYRLTDSTLLIKNQKTIDAIKAGNGYLASQLFDKYKRWYGFPKLAEIFYRFKPLFLAFKPLGLSKEINKIRNLAVKYHKPMSIDLLNDITRKIKYGESINIVEFKVALDKVNLFRSIRLMQALRNMQLTDIELGMVKYGLLAKKYMVIRYNTHV